MGTFKLFTKSDASPLPLVSVFVPAVQLVPPVPPSHPAPHRRTADRDGSCRRLAPPACPGRWGRRPLGHRCTGRHIGHQRHGCCGLGHGCPGHDQPPARPRASRHRCWGGCGRAADDSTATAPLSRRWRPHASTARLRHQGPPHGWSRASACAGPTIGPSQSLQPDDGCLPGSCRCGARPGGRARAAAVGRAATAASATARRAAEQQQQPPVLQPNQLLWMSCSGCTSFRSSLQDRGRPTATSVRTAGAAPKSRTRRGG